MKTMTLDLVDSDADISDCEKYRYKLWRIWDPTKPLLYWMMLNPSTAGKKENDATIRKCIGFAQLWGYGGIMVVNLFAWRARDPNELKVPGRDLLGDNDQKLAEIGSLDQVVCAWGSNAIARKRAGVVLEIFRGMGAETRCLRLTKNGDPWHPLYVPYSTELLPFGGAL